MAHRNRQSRGLNVVIVGAGIGGLTCAIACCHANPPLEVTVLEKTPELLAIGAGIHIPPNSIRVLGQLGVVDDLRRGRAYDVENFTLRRHEDGKILASKPLSARCKQEYGAHWLATHRGDYQSVLLDGARKSGARLILDADVVSVKAGDNGGQIVSLKDGRRLDADVVIGADGLWSLLRETVLGYPKPPQETGDLAFRGTFTREQLEAFQDDKINELMKASDMQVWLGPDRHAGFYPLRNHTEYNLVLLCADDMPQGVRTAQGTVDEMAMTYQGFDPTLTKLISCLKSALKWKLLHFEALEKWTKGSIALLGDASHPTLPYQGQGAAMAVEDGAIIGLLLSKLQSHGLSPDSLTRDQQISKLLLLYESLRKERTETNVAGAVRTREFYHLHDGPEQRKRDEELGGFHGSDWKGRSRWVWADAEYQRSLLGFDVLEDAGGRFDQWVREGGLDGVEGREGAPVGENRGGGLRL